MGRLDNSNHSWGTQLPPVFVLRRRVRSSNALATADRQTRCRTSKAPFGSTRSFAAREQRPAPRGRAFNRRACRREREIRSFNAESSPAFSAGRSGIEASILVPRRRACCDPWLRSVRFGRSRRGRVHGAGRREPGVGRSRDAKFGRCQWSGRGSRKCWRAGRYGGRD